MEDRKVIFLHSMFRTGSTYMFNKFRSSEKFTTYYEPLHHDLIKLKKDSLDIWKYNKKATKVMNHPELEKPHFYEFQAAFNCGDEQLPFYDVDFAYKEFFSVEKEKKLKNYIDNIINVTDEKKIPLFQFNRTSLRINWFRNNYPSSLNLFLLRNPRDQFESYIQRGKIGKNIFLAINLYIALLDKKASIEVLKKQKRFEVSNNITKDLVECMKLTKNYSIKEHYRIFFYIWTLSYFHAEKYTDFIIDMDRINNDGEYLEKIKEKLEIYSQEKLDFKDYKIKNNDFLFMEYKKIIKIEENVMNILDLTEVNKEKISLYLNNFNFQKFKKETLFSKFLRKIIK